MTVTVTACSASSNANPWPDIVSAVLHSEELASLRWRDAVLLVPFAQHLPLARKAWAAAGGWLPRIETTQTLARTLAPAVVTPPLALTFDNCADRLIAIQLLRGPSWTAWALRDAMGFTQSLDAVVATAQALWRAAANVAPGQREQHWQTARQAFAPHPAGSGPGGTERLLARAAFEWAQASMALAPPATDALFSLPVSAWIGVSAGGVDALTASLFNAASDQTPCVWVDTDAAPERPFEKSHAPLQLAVCQDFEDEAQQTAACVLAALAHGQQPVALVSLDRLLVRRTRALLERRGVAMADETGWTLSTTRAAASLLGLLKALQADAGADEVLNGLAPCALASEANGQGASALAELETAMRRHGWRRAAQVDAARLPAGTARWWLEVQALGAPFRTGPAVALARWMQQLRAVLAATALGPQLAADEAGRQMMAALEASTALAPATGEGDAMPVPEFMGWLDRVLESASFLPAAAPHAAVVITPLERTMLRPFAAIVLPGADEKRLPATASSGPALLSEAEAMALGLPDRAARMRAQTQAFAQLLHGAPVTLLRRLDDGGQPLAASPLLARLLLARERSGQGWVPVADARVRQRFEPQPAAFPLPAAPALLPQRLSASACEALRACPYRFFALRMLALQESPELEADVEKREYGSWLHRVLHQFHVQRPAAASAADDRAQLLALGAALPAADGASAAAFLPFAATFGRFVPRYVDWLQRHEARGARWLDGERTFTASPPDWGTTQMHGVIDRIDSAPGDAGPLTVLIDYKTAGAQGLRQTLKRPQEDTQLAFYAALLQAQSAAPGEVAAFYLALDEAQGIAEVPHADVAATAEQLVTGIGHDLARMRAGAALPALGEGRACEHCDARGLCRRDQWAPR